MVQLIALMYKDQHISTLQKLLNLWFEASLSESSEDNESNTSPPVSIADIIINSVSMLRNLHFRLILCQIISPHWMLNVHWLAGSVVLFANYNWLRNCKIDFK
jgi:hypothetical protein